MCAFLGLGGACPLHVTSKLRPLNRSQSSADLKMWRQPWRQAEKPKRRSVATRAPLPSDVEGKGGLAPETAAADGVPSRPLLASYISSEHCYQKPCAYYPAGERRLVVETWGGSPSTELERGPLGTEEPPERECGTARGAPDRTRRSPVSLASQRHYCCT